MAFEEKVAGKKNKGKKKPRRAQPLDTVCLNQMHEGLCFLSTYIRSGWCAGVRGKRSLWFVVFFVLWPCIVALLALFRRQDGAVVLRHCFAQLAVCQDCVSPWHQGRVSLQGCDRTPELLSQKLYPRKQI